MFDGGGGEVLGVGGGGVESSQQGQGLAAEGVFDQGQLVEIFGAQDRLDPGGFGVDAALATGAAQQRGELGDSQYCGCSRGGGGGQQGPRFGTQKTAAFIGEGLKQGWVVLA